MITKKLKLVIIDDYEENAATNVARVQKGLGSAGFTAEVTPMSVEDKNFIIEKIEQIDDKWKLDLDNLPSFPMFDGVDVVFIDYQLGALKKHSWLTAEDMAGWIRAFTDVPLIVILNKYYDVDFDLNMSQGSIPSAADFHMNAESLVCAGLWKLPSWEFSGSPNEFRPWHWAQLHEVVDEIRFCRDQLNSDTSLFGKVILEYFGFSDDLADQMTHHALGFLDPSSKTPQAAKFDDLLKHGRLGIASKLQAELYEGITIPAVCRSAINVLVSSLRRWLASMILGPQDVLIDLPHLLQRMPWLAKGDITASETWNRTILPNGIEYFPPEIMKFSYSNRQWISKDTFLMPSLQASDDVLDLYSRSENPAQQGSYVFLEDFSVFVPTEEAESFTAAYNSIWSTRYVSKRAVEDGEIRYAPKVRLV
jgi:hypothetical protein